MKKKVGIITFHASHNYGSMLQAYALQQVVLNMGCDCKIINFRTERQKEFYRPHFKRGNIVGRIKRTLIYLPFMTSLCEKDRLFESFLRTQMLLTEKEYSTLADLFLEDFDFDYIISGSDQIWNTRCLDFDWAYYLPFVKKAKKIAYAPSMGPNAKNDVDDIGADKIKDLLLQYSAISVREQGTESRLKSFTGNNYPILLDPTLLLLHTYWSKMAGNKPLISGRYIFLYVPWFHKIVFDKAKEMAKSFNLRIIVSQLYNTRENTWIFDSDFKPYLRVGPIEFLNLCKFADCVIGMSFHLVVFSILLHTPFYAIKGMDDDRIKDLLLLTGLESRSISEEAENFSLDAKIDFYEVNRIINGERIKCLEWLNNCFS